MNESQPAAATTVGQRIRQRRRALGLSQRQLAAAGISYAYVSRLETDARQPSITVLRRLARTLGVDVYWLETGRPDPARALAQLVLAFPGQPLPPHATALAHAILSTDTDPPN